MISFPSELPSPLLRGNSAQFGEHFRRTDVAEGVPRFIQTTAQPFYLFDILWLFTSREYNRFQNWYTSPNELAFNGWFSIDLFVGDTQTYALVTGGELEEGLFERLKTPITCHFTEPYQWQIDPDSGRFQVAARLLGNYVAIPNAAGVIDIYDGGTVGSPSNINEVDGGTVDAPSIDILDALTLEDNNG